MPDPADNPPAFPLPSNSSVNDSSTNSIANLKALTEMHANSQYNAVIYIAVVLLVYAFAMVLLLIKYVKRERYEDRLSYIYEEFVRRDRFIKKQQSTEIKNVGTLSPVTCPSNKDTESEKLVILQQVTPV